MWSFFMLNLNFRKWYFCTFPFVFYMPGIDFISSKETTMISSKVAIYRDLMRCDYDGAAHFTHSKTLGNTAKNTLRHSDPFTPHLLTSQKVLFHEFLPIIIFSFWFFFFFRDNSKQIFFKFFSFFSVWFFRVVVF